MDIITKNKVRVEVYKEERIISVTNGSKQITVPDIYFDYCKIIPLNRFELLEDKCNSELADIYDNNEWKYIAKYLDKDTAKQITKLLNNLNNK